MKKPRIYVDMDGVLCDYMASRRKGLEKTPENGYPQAAYGFFRDMGEMEGAIEAYQFLDEHFDTWILTRPSVLNPMSYTEKREWVEKHLGIAACDKLIMCTEKGLLKGDYLIDDTPWPKFKGEQLFFGSKEFPDWKAVVEFFQMLHDWPGCEFKKFSTMDHGLYYTTYVDIFKNGEAIKRIKLDLNGGIAQRVRAAVPESPRVGGSITSPSTDADFEKKILPLIEGVVGRVHEALNGHDYVDPSEKLHDILKFIRSSPITMAGTKEKLEKLLDVLDGKTDVAIFKDVTIVRAVVQDLLDTLILKEALEE